LCTGCACQLIIKDNDDDDDDDDDDDGPSLRLTRQTLEWTPSQFRKKRRRPRVAWKYRPKQLPRNWT